MVRPRISEDWDPEFVWVSIEGWPGATELRGREAFMAFWEEWVAPYEQLDVSIERVLDAGGDEVLLLGCQRGRLRGSDSWVEFRYGLIYTVERGKITRVQAYSTQDCPTTTSCSTARRRSASTSSGPGAATSTESTRTAEHAAGLGLAW